MTIRTNLNPYISQPLEANKLKKFAVRAVFELCVRCIGTCTCALRGFFTWYYNNILTRGTICTELSKEKGPFDNSYTSKILIVCATSDRLQSSYMQGGSQDFGEGGAFINKRGRFAADF